jgi:hypothetical protein
MPSTAMVGQQVLDGPPPSPQMTGGGPTGQPPVGFKGMAPPAIPSDQLPPEVLTGMMQAASKIGDMLDSFAQMAPDLAQDFGQLKDQLQAVLAKLMQSGAGPTNPTAAGSQFPGGGADRGIAGGGTV